MTEMVSVEKLDTVEVGYLETIRVVMRADKKARSLEV